MTALQSSQFFATISNLSHRRKALAFLIFTACVLLLGNNSVSLWDQDEAAYAGFAANMIKTGDWLVPHFTWGEVHRKPPLHFWDIALSYKIFGVNEFAVRFPSAMCVLLTLASIFVAGKKIFGERQALYSMVVLGTSFLVVALAKVSTTDATLLFYTTACAWSMLHVLLFRRRKAVAAFWFAFAMAVLTKGPPVVMFACVMAGLFVLFHPLRRNLILLHPWFFLPLALAPLFVWGYLCAQQPGGPELISWMLDFYILKRVTGSVFGQTGPPGTHLLGMMVFFLPYFLFFPRAAYDGITNLFRRDKGNGFLLSVWFIAGWLLFEFSPSKLPAYVLAAHVPLALLLANVMLTRPLPHRGVYAAHIALNLIVFVALAAAPWYLELPLLHRMTFTVAGVVFIAAFIFIHAKPRSENYMKRLMLFNIAFHAVVWVLLLPLADVVKNSSLLVAQHLEAKADRATPIVIAHNHSSPPSLPFYLQQRFTNVTEQYDPVALAQLYANSAHVALILDQSLKDILVQVLPDIQFTEIRPVFTDRINVESYYVVVK